jgi:hypothetical protein
MLIYLINLSVVVLAAYLARKSKYALFSKFLLGIAFVSMVLVAGLRNRTVGSDTGDYIRDFNNIRTLADVAAYGSTMGEYGFWILIWLIHFVSNDYMVFFTAIALIVVGCYQRAIIAYSGEIGISFFVFIAMGFYTFFFNGARQGIACAIYALAIGPMFDRNFKKYFAFVLLAFLFHKTAIMTLPVYFIVNRDNTIKNNLFIVLIGGVAATFYENIVEVASRVDARYAYNLVPGEGGGYLMAAFSFVLGVFFLAFKKSVHIDRARYDRFLNMFVFGVMIGGVSTVLSANPSGALRFRVYFEVASVFLWPIVFMNISDRLSKFVLGYFFVIGFLIFYVLTTQRFSDLVPYNFNPSLPLR